MNGYRVVGLCRELVEHPAPHRHVVAVACVTAETRRTEATHVWTQDRICADGGWARFGMEGDARAFTVWCCSCSECGALCLRIEPPTWAQLLPEYKLTGQALCQT